MENQEKLLTYHVITAGTAPSLSDRVTQYLREGWQLEGGVTVAQLDNVMEVETGGVSIRVWAQAVTRMMPEGQ
jgi:hypothetical protein